MPVRPAVKPAAAIAAFLSIKNPFRQVLLTTKASLRKLLTSERQQRGLNASKFANNHEIISEGLYDFSGWDGGQRSGPASHWNRSLRKRTLAKPLT